MCDFSLSYMQKWIYNEKYMVNLAVTIEKMISDDNGNLSVN